MKQPNPPQALRRVTQLWGILLWWAALLVIWVALVGKIGTLELLAGAAAAGVAAIGTAVVRQRDRQRFAVAPGHLVLLARRLPGKVLRDCATVAAALFGRLAGQRVHGRSRVLPFETGEDSNARDAGRRALVVAGISVAPNTFVVDVDRGRSMLLLHDLVPRPEVAAADPRWPL